MLVLPCPCSLTHFRHVAEAARRHFGSLGQHVGRLGVAVTLAGGETMVVLEGELEALVQLQSTTQSEGLLWLSWEELKTKLDYEASESHPMG